MKILMIHLFQVDYHSVLNLVSVLTGTEELRKNHWPKWTAEFDLCPWLFKNFNMADIGTAYDENFPYYNMFINRRTGFRVSLQDSWKIKMSRKYVWMKDRFTMSCRLHE